MTYTKQVSEEAEEKENIELAATSARISDNGYQELNVINLQSALNINFGENKATAVDNGDGTFTIKINDRWYTIDNKEKVKKDINWDLAKQNAKAPNSQHEERNNGVIGIGTDGNPVNMDLWEYTLLNNDTYGLNTEDALNSVERTKGYIGGYTSEGEIIGTIPTYISIDEGNTYKPVTSMVHTFYNCEDLLKMPILPNTLVNMNLCFFKAYNLSEVSSIPNRVTTASYSFRETKIHSMPILGENLSDIQQMFSQCTYLTNTTTIPDSVINMNSAFFGDISLTNPPNIPCNVKELLNTFCGCTSLTTTPLLPEGLTSLQTAFQNCTSLSNVRNIPNSVENLRGAFMNCTSLKNIPNYISNNVTNMMQTFNGCTSLEGEVQINATLTGKVVYTYNNKDYYDYAQAFEHSAGINGSGIIILKSSTCKSDILEIMISQSPSGVRMQE